MHRLFPIIIKWPLVLSIILINIFFIFFKDSYIYIYSIVFIGGFGFILTKYFDRIRSFLSQSHLNRFVLFLMMAYGMVLFEETIVGILHALTEGFSLTGTLIRISQFWAFNIIAFSGFIFGWYFSIRRYAYSVTDIFIISGIWGIFAERIYPHIFTGNIIALLLILPIMCSYTLIITPALLSVPNTHQKNKPIIIRYSYPIFITLILSIPLIIILSSLRLHYPHMFPPCEYIPCGQIQNAKV